MNIMDTSNDAQTAFQNQGRSLGFPSIAFNGRAVEGEVAYGIAARSASPFQLEGLADQLRSLQIERARQAAGMADLDDRDAQRAADRNSDDPLARLDAERAAEMAAVAAFRQTDSGRLEKIIELNEQILDALKARP
jgi:hypothetical protein